MSACSCARVRDGRGAGRPRGRRLVAVVVAAVSLLSASGCIRQRLIVKSDPPGADLLLNGFSERRKTKRETDDNVALATDH